MTPPQGPTPTARHPPHSPRTAAAADTTGAAREQAALHLRTGGPQHACCSCGLRCCRVPPSSNPWAVAKARVGVLRQVQPRAACVPVAQAPCNNARRVGDWHASAVRHSVHWRMHGPVHILWLVARAAANKRGVTSTRPVACRPAVQHTHTHTHGHAPCAAAPHPPPHSSRPRARHPPHPHAHRPPGRPPRPPPHRLQPPPPQRCCCRARHCASRRPAPRACVSVEINGACVVITKAK